MNKKKTLFYKGISGFTARTHLELLEKATVSPYRWWFEVLRCSKDYWWVCKQKGKTLDADLNKVWLAFGDVFSTDFSRWWIKTGYALFEEQVSPPKIEQVSPYAAMEHLHSSQRLLLSIPLDISEKSLKQQFQRILRDISGRQIRRGDAKFKLEKTKGIRLKVIETALRVWQFRFEIDYNKAHSVKAASADKMDLYDIGDHFNISTQHKRRAGEPDRSRILKERVMRVAVIRMTNRAEALIENAEIGQFPSYEKVTPRKRWTKQQQQALDKAVLDGKWSPYGISEVDLRDLRRRYGGKDIWI